MKYKDILEKKAYEIMEQLLHKKIKCDLPEESFTEYSVKITVDDSAVLILYYSPKRESFKITVQKNEESLSGDALKILDPYMDKKIDTDVYRNTGYEADVDGSFMNGTTGWAYIIRKDGKVKHKDSGTISLPGQKNSHQVAGEIKAVMECVKYCREKGIHNLTLYYDMKGLEQWAKGRWKTNTFITKSYREYMKNQMISIDWIKVSSHTGVKWNEEADRLAKQEVKKKSGN
ncbi:MAG: reverse transcriptase-like protein [Ignavibacteria bacterium]|nr:reverse transcriptase-like protein [Ignavibacteria bacterium]